MKNQSSNKRTAILGIILLGLLVIAYKVMFVPSPDSASLEGENQASSLMVEGILKQIDTINFDTSVIKDPKFESLRSMETPPITLPVGKENPFSPI